MCKILVFSPCYYLGQLWQGPILAHCAFCPCEGIMLCKALVGRAFLLVRSLFVGNCACKVPWQLAFTVFKLVPNRIFQRVFWLYAPLYIPTEPYPIHKEFLNFFPFYNFHYAYSREPRALELGNAWGAGCSWNKHKLKVVVLTGPYFWNNTQLQVQKIFFFLSFRTQWVSGGHSLFQNDLPLPFMEEKFCFLTWTLDTLESFCRCLMSSV